MLKNSKKEKLFQLKKNEQRVMTYLNNNGKSHASDVAEALNIPPREVINIFYKLDEIGLTEEPTTTIN